MYVYVRSSVELQGPPTGAHPAQLGGGGGHPPGGVCKSRFFEVDTADVFEVVRAAGDRVYMYIGMCVLHIPVQASLVDILALCDGFPA